MEFVEGVMLRERLSSPLSGLGLSMTYDIIKMHEGTLAVDTKVGEFTEFSINLAISPLQGV